MQVSPAKHTLESVTDGRTDGRMKDGQSDPYVSVCFAGDTKKVSMTTRVTGISFVRVVDSYRGGGGGMLNLNHIREV